MNAMTTPTAEAFRLFDPQLIALLIELADNGQGEAALPWTQMGERLGRDPSNVTRSTRRMADTGLISLFPLAISDKARSILAAWNGEPLPAAPVVSDTGAGAVADWSQIETGREYHIPHNLIHPSPLNPRKTFDHEALDELADGIAEKGLLQNIVVRPHPQRPGEFEIAAGERRWRAVGRLIERDGGDPFEMRALVQAMSDEELLLVALAENRDRLDPPAMEEARGIAAFRELRVRQILGEIYPNHWETGIEEPQMAPERRMAEGIATKECAAAMGKTERWVQLRMNLVEDLAPELQEALDRQAISLAQARAIRKFRFERQVNALPLMTDAQPGWRTYDEVRNSMRSAGLPAGEAAFDPADYSGETAEDPETGETIYLDKALVTTLQTVAMKRRRKELQAEGAAFVVILEGWDDTHKFPPAEEDTALPVGYVLRLNTHSNRIEERRAVRRDDMNRSGQQPIKVAPVAAEGGQDGATTKQEVVQPYAKRHWLQAAKANTARLRAALAGASTAEAVANLQYAHAIAIIGMMDQSMYRGSETSPEGWFGRVQRWGDDSEIPTAPCLAERVAALAENGKPAGFEIKPPLAIVSDRVKALHTLLAAGEAEVSGIFVALIADKAGLWPGHAAGPGCDAFTYNLADELESGLPAWELTADWLEPFTTAQLRMIARACGIGAGAADMPGKKTDAVAWILSHPDRDPAWQAPELTFAGPEAVDREVKYMLAGKGGAA